MKLIDVSVLKEWVENWFTKNRFYHPFAKNNNIPIPELYDILDDLPAAEPEPCDFCAYRDDCEEMRIYCPARPLDRQTERSE